jgi:hypothetical protein
MKVEVATDDEIWISGLPLASARSGGLLSTFLGGCPFNVCFFSYYI